MNSLRMLWSTGMDWLAQSMRRLPRSASSRVLISNEICGAAVVDMFSCLGSLTKAVRFYRGRKTYTDIYFVIPSAARNLLWRLLKQIPHTLALFGMTNH